MDKENAGFLRTDIPNFIGKRVTIIGLKDITNLNGKMGFVEEWNDEIQRFKVRLLKTENGDDQSSLFSNPKLVKPSKLIYTPEFKIEKEIELKKLVNSHELRNFEKGMEAFDELG